MPTARLICKRNPSDARWEIVVEQMDFTPAEDQVVEVPGRGRFIVLGDIPEVHHVSAGAGLPAKWLNVVKVERADKSAKPGKAIKG